MLISKLPERMPIWFDTQQCISLVGPSGIGKTAMILQSPQIIKAATGRNIGVVIFNAATYTPMHLLGFGVVKHHESYSEMRFSDPFFFRDSLKNLRLHDYTDGGIIFVDEADKGDPDVMKNICELAYSKRIGMHLLPPGWCVWMASNPVDARYGSKKQLDYAINRQGIIPVSSDPQGWLNWGASSGLLPFTLAFADQNKSVVFSDRLPEKQGPWCTPRSLHLFDTHLQSAMRIKRLSTPPDDEAIVEEAEGYIGAAAQAYFTQLKTSIGMPKLADILADPEGCALPSTDCMALLSYNLAYDVSVQNAEKVIKYVERLPTEFASTFVRAAVHRNPKLITAKSVGQWAQKHSKLLQLIAKYGV